MTREEAINILKAIQAFICPNKKSVLENNFSKAFDTAIEALSEDISEDGTLKVKVKDGSKVNRVLVLGDNHFGGLYYPDRPEGEWKGERVKSVGDVWEKTWYRCSKCKKHEYRKTNFCPNCGADMRGEK